MQTSHIIAEMLDQSRKFNRYYMSLLDPARIHESYQLEGMAVNSALWIVGHLVWAEIGIVNETNDGQIDQPDWLEPFKIKARDFDPSQAPTWETMHKDMVRVHADCLAYIRAQSDEDLELPAFVAPAQWNTTRKKSFYHAIRHESFHTGQLSWIAKLHGGRTP